MCKISVLMSVYNGEKYIKETIESILNQTYKNFEFIIINDGSTDNTREIIESYNDSKIKLYNLQRNMGVGEALNFGLSKCNGKYIAKADSDDIYDNKRLEKQNKFLDENLDIALVKTLIEYFPENKKVEKSERYKFNKSYIEIYKNMVTESEDISKKIYWYCCIPHTSIMVRGDIAKKVEYRPFRIWEDYDFFYRLNKLGYKMGTVKEKLVEVRICESSTTVKYNRDLKEIILTIKQDEIDNLLKDNRPLYLWGAGVFGQDVLSTLEKNNVKVEGFIDINKEKIGNSIKGLNVYSPEFIKDKNCIVIITSQPGMLQIVKNLEENSFKHLKDYIVYH
ncbi:MAG: glycosyltransferase [Clostridiaceae bacterium]